MEHGTESREHSCFGRWVLQSQLPRLCLTCAISNQQPFPLAMEGGREGIESCPGEGSGWGAWCPSSSLAPANTNTAPLGGKGAVSFGCDGKGAPSSRGAGLGQSSVTMLGRGEARPCSLDWSVVQMLGLRPPGLILPQTMGGLGESLPLSAH